MPILPAEADVYPDCLLDGATPAESRGRRWWALHTKPRQEKSLARCLCSAGVAFYLPTVSRRCRIRGRIMTSRIPLFPSYLFLLADDEGRVAALTTNRVVRSLEVHDQSALWHDLRQVHGLIASGLPITPEDRLAAGMRVTVNSGPLAGLQGTIVRSATGRRFVVSVDFIQQGASAVIDDFALTPLDPVPSPLREG